MKLKDYAAQQGISYRTAWRWWKLGKLPGHQMDTGTILVDVEPPGPTVPKATRVAIYARVSSAENKPNLDSQAERLVAYCAAKGYQEALVVKEIGSGVNDARPKLLALLEDPSIGLIVVEHKALFRVITIAETDRLITCFGGLLVQPQAIIREHPPLDMLVVPGGHVSDLVANQKVLEWILQQDRQTRLTTSVCTGAFVLAKCGLLDQHRATTHWSGIESLRERYPAIEVVADARFVDEGHLITSAGISAGIEMSLHVVARLFGEQVAAEAARGMEYEWSARGRS